jgi:hypothetical protein
LGVVYGLQLYQNFQACNWSFSIQQRVKSSSTADHLRELASHYTQAEAKVQQLEKLRPLYEDYVKLVLKTVPTTEKMTVELEQDYQTKIQAMNDVWRLCLYIFLMGSYTQI